MVSEDAIGLKALSESSHNRYQYDRPEPDLLEKFKKPKEGNEHLTIDIHAPEFTSLCPITGQPDFATIHVSYIPNQYCVESKSFKLYLGSFRNHGEFHESCTARICNDLVWLLDPIYIRVFGEFTPRGGIAFHPVAEHWKNKKVRDEAKSGRVGT